MTAEAAGYLPAGRQDSGGFIILQAINTVLTDYIKIIHHLFCYK
jgi:hypothetical protein